MTQIRSRVYLSVLHSLSLRILLSNPFPPSLPPFLLTSDERHWRWVGGLGGILLLHADTVPGEGQPEAEDASLSGSPQSQEHVLQGQLSMVTDATQWILSIKDTLNIGHLSNEDTPCCLNHIELCINPCMYLWDLP